VSNLGGGSVTYYEPYPPNSRRQHTVKRLPPRGHFTPQASATTAPSFPLTVRGDLAKLPVATLVEHIKTFREQLGALEDEVVRRLDSNGVLPQTPAVHSRTSTQELSGIGVPAFQAAQTSSTSEAPVESAVLLDSGAAHEADAEANPRGPVEVYKSLEQLIPTSPTKSDIGHLYPYDSDYSNQEAQDVQREYDIQYEVGPYFDAQRLGVFKVGTNGPSDIAINKSWKSDIQTRLSFRAGDSRPITPVPTTLHFQQSANNATLGRRATGDDTADSQALLETTATAPISAVPTEILTTHSTMSEIGFRVDFDGEDVVPDSQQEEDLVTEYYKNLKKNVS